jgi:hypothetical protein
MIWRLFAADRIKIRRSMVWFLVFLGPFGVIALTALNFLLRYDYLINYYAGDLWGNLLANLQGLTAMALLLGAMLIASLVAGIEHRTNAWKQLLALPVSRFWVFLSKFLLCAWLLILSSILLAVGSYLLGGLLGFGWQAPWETLLKNSFYPTLAGMAIVALQLWLSVLLRNQAVAVTAGIIGTILGLYSFKLPDWLLWKWPLAVTQVSDPVQPLAAGLLTALFLAVLGAIHFTRKDVE